MDQALQWLSHPFSLGLLLGLVFFGLACTAHFRTKIEFRRYRKLLGDKMELESRQFETLRKEKDQLAKQNENLRIKNAQSNDTPQNKLERELEILARAEKQMVVNAPGFAPAWENAKTQALNELVEEERGSTLPKRIYRKFFGGTKEIAAESVTDAPETPVAQTSPESTPSSS